MDEYTLEKSNDGQWRVGRCGFWDFGGADTYGNDYGPNWKYYETEKEAREDFNDRVDGRRRKDKATRKLEARTWTPVEFGPDEEKDNG